MCEPLNGEIRVTFANVITSIVVWKHLVFYKVGVVYEREGKKTLFLVWLKNNNYIHPPPPPLIFFPWQANSKQYSKPATESRKGGEKDVKIEAN